MKECGIFFQRFALLDGIGCCCRNRNTPLRARLPPTAPFVWASGGLWTYTLDVPKATHARTGFSVGMPSMDKVAAERGDALVPSVPSKERACKAEERAPSMGDFPPSYRGLEGRRCAVRRCAFALVRSQHLERHASIFWSCPRDDESSLPRAWSIVFDIPLSPPRRSVRGAFGGWRGARSTGFPEAAPATADIMDDYDGDVQVVPNTFRQVS